jgi:shikimate kinase
MPGSQGLDGPKPAERLWLTGLMGAGKSTVGRAVAARAEVRYVDNDATIAREAGHPTADLAADAADLHSWESRYASEVARMPPRIVAGIPASVADRPDDLELLAATGLIVYLRCDLSTLVARVRAGPPRPFMDADMGALLAEMLAKREPVLLRVAALVVDEPQPVDHMVSVIMDAAGWT